MQSRTDHQIFEEFFRAHKLLERITYLTFLNWEDLKSDSERTGQDLIGTLEDSFEPHLSKTDIDRVKFRQQLTSLANDAVAKPGGLKFFETEATGGLRAVIQDRLQELRDKIVQIPNTLEKAPEMLRGLVNSQECNLIEPIQIYDAMVFLADELSNEVPQKIFELWKKDYKERNQYRAGFGPFWLPNTGFESLDTVSHFLFREKFRIGGFNDIFDDARNDLLITLLDESEGPRTVLGARNDLSANMLLWQISRSASLPYSLSNGIEISLARLFAAPNPHMDLP